MVLAMSLAVLAYACVGICVLAVAHLLAKLYGFLQDREREHLASPRSRRKTHPGEASPLPPLGGGPKKDKGLANSFSGFAPPTPTTPRKASLGDGLRQAPLVMANRKVSVMDSHLARLAAQMSDKAGESKWKGWQEVRRDASGRRSVKELHQRNLMGAMSVAEVEPRGAFVLVANSSAAGAQPHTENLSGWLLLRRVSDDSDAYRAGDEMAFEFPGNTFVRPNATLKVFAADFAEERGLGDLVAEHVPTWRHGDFQETLLLNGSEEVMSSVFWTTEYFHPNTDSEGF